MTLNLDISALQSLISTAKAKQDIGYTASSWQALQSAISAAESLLSSTGYTQTQVDNAKNTLQNALDSLVSITSLQSLITTAKAKQDIGYTASSWQVLQSAISAAESLLSSTGYTQIQVDNAKTTLQNALDALVLLPDSSTLQALINQAENIQNDGYTDESYNHLLDIIDSAKSLLDGKNYEISELETEIIKLQSAINGLEYVLPDTTELVLLLNEADAITDIGYTVPTWTRFDTARTAGHTLLSLPVYTQIEVSETQTELQSSMDGLTLAAVTPPYVPPVLGFDLGSGDVSGFLAPALPLFSGYVMSVMPVVISFFSIYFGLKLLPHVFTRIMKALRK